MVACKENLHWYFLINNFFSLTFFSFISSLKDPSFEVSDFFFFRFSSLIIIIFCPRLRRERCRWTGDISASRLPPDFKIINLLIDRFLPLGLIFLIYNWSVFTFGFDFFFIQLIGFSFGFFIYKNVNLSASDELPSDFKIFILLIDRFLPLDLMFFM